MTNPNPFTGPQQAWIPSDNALLGAVSDPFLAATSNVLTAGTVYLGKLTVRQATVMTNLWFGLATAGTGASTGSFAGLYSSAGALLTGSADIAAALTGAVGGISVALTTPQAVPAGSFVWGAVVSNLATTQPSLARGSQTGAIPNLGLTAAAFRSASGGTVQTSLPASFTPSGLTSATDYWMGWS